MALACVRSDALSPLAIYCLGQGFVTAPTSFAYLLAYLTLALASQSQIIGLEVTAYNFNITLTRQFIAIAGRRLRPARYIRAAKHLFRFRCLAGHNRVIEIGGGTLRRSVLPRINLGNTV